jgi:CubicO group peptidase (beta-lactamase class C family)
MIRPAAVLLFMLFAAATQAHAQDTAISQYVDRVFAEWTGDSTPGCAVGVERHGRPVLTRAYGMADLEHGIRNAPETIFEAGSVAKQFTAAAVVLLALDGLLTLDDDVRKYVPELPDYGHTITLRHLLTHTSGLRDWGSVAAIAGWSRGARTHTHDHVVDILSRQRALNFEPGTEYSYSNSGYNLLAVIVDRVSGMPFAEFSRTRIFEPLGLTSTQWRDDYRRIVPGRSSAYGASDAGWAIDRPIENVHGNGGLLTTVRDLLVWSHALESGAVGGAEFTRVMHERGVLNDGRMIDYASGLVIGEIDDQAEVSHTGATAGYRAFLGRYPDSKLGVAVLCNAGNVNPGQVGRRVARIALRGGAAAEAPTAAERSREEPPQPPEPALAELESLVGEYYSPEVEATLRVVLDDGRLVLLRRPADRVVLRPVEKDLFAAGPLGRIRFIREGESAVQLSVQQARVYDLRFDRVR